MICSQFDALCSQDSEIRDFMSGFTAAEKFDAASALMLYSICNFRMMFDMTPSVEKLKSIAGKARAMLPNRPKEAPTTDVQRSVCENRFHSRPNSKHQKAFSQVNLTTIDSTLDFSDTSLMEGRIVDQSANKAILIKGLHAKAQSRSHSKFRNPSLNLDLERLKQQRPASVRPAARQSLDLSQPPDSQNTYAKKYKDTKASLNRRTHTSGLQEITNEVTPDLPSNPYGIYKTASPRVYARIAHRQRDSYCK